MNLTKKERSQLRQSVSLAYSRELDSHLDKLLKEFEKWKNSQIDCWDLNDLIHKFHDGISRDLYKLYNYNDNYYLLIERALSLNFIKKEELPLVIQENIHDSIFFKSD